MLRDKPTHKTVNDVEEREEERNTYKFLFIRNHAFMQEKNDDRLNLDRRQIKRL